MINKSRKDASYQATWSDESVTPLIPTAAGPSKADALDKRAARTVRIGTLYDFYGVLLTVKQQEMIQLHFFDDWSLAEIAAHLDVSRQAIHDNLRRAEEQLDHYEQALGLARAHSVQRHVMQQLLSAWSEAANYVPVPERDRFQALLVELKSQLEM